MPKHKGKRKGMTNQMNFQQQLRSENSSVMPNQDTLSTTQEATKERTEQSENQEATAEPCEIQGASLDPQPQDLEYENNLLPGSKRQNIDPTEIYYTQNSISSRFSDKMLIRDTLDDLRKGTCRVEDIPSIRVYKHRGRWCSMDNRRLWVFKQLKPPGETIPVIVVPVKSVKPIPERISLKVRVREDHGNQRRRVEKRHREETTDGGSPPKKQTYPDKNN